MIERVGMSIINKLVNIGTIGEHRRRGSARRAWRRGPGRRAWRRWALICGCVAAIGLVKTGAAAPHRTAILQGLDKVTARVSKIEAPIGTTVRFGTLEIIARHCDKRPPEETPESAAFLDIWEARRGEAAIGIFRGWMFASSPALSGMEHPVYDVWVLKCTGEVAEGVTPGSVPGGAPGTAPGATSGATKKPRLPFKFPGFGKRKNTEN